MTRMWAVVLLGACTSPRGALEVRVMPPEDQTELAMVRLFVGIKDERDGLQLRPPGYLGPVPAVWWERDRAPEFDDQPVGKPVPDGGYLVRYALAEGGQDAVHALVAVGYDTADVPRALGSYLDRIEIPVGQIVEYEMPLSTRFTPLPRVAVDGLAGLQVWSRDSDTFACVQVDNARFIDTYEGAQTAIIGPHDDMDCDGLVDGNPKECVRNEYLGQVPFSSRADLTCVTTETAAANEPASEMIVAGGVTCEDNYGRDPDRCSPSSYCLPSAFPRVCPRFGCDPFATPGTAPNAPLSYILCDVDVRLNGNVREFCELPVTIDLSEQMPGVSCGGPPSLRDRDHEFATTLDTDHYDIEITATAGGPCVFELTPRGLAAGQVHALLAVPMTAPVDGRGLVLPIRIAPPSNTTTNECPGQQFQRLCQVVIVEESRGEGLHRCLKTPVTSGTTVDPTF